MTDGLKDKFRKAIIDILATHPGVERAVLFGSRAMGTFTVTSDVDIALFGGKLTLGDQAELATAIEALSIPQQVDLLLHKSIRSKKLLEHIKRHGVEWWRWGESVGGDLTTIGAVAEVFDGPHATPTKIEEGPYFLSISSLDDGKLDLTHSAHLSEEQFKKWTRRVTPTEGDVLFSYETRIGEAAMMPAGIRACLGRRMGLLRPNLCSVIPEYLLYAYLSPVFQGEIKSRTIHGSTVPRIALKELPCFPIRVPELSEQRKVVSVLKSLDDKIELNRQMNRTLEKMAQVIFKSWFIDFDPVVWNAVKANKPVPKRFAETATRYKADLSVAASSKAEGRDTGLPKEIVDLFPDGFEDSELGEIPRGWEVGLLGDIAKNPRRGIKPDTVPPAMPYIGLQDMPKRCIALDKWGRADEVGSQKSQFAKGEILFGKLRPYFHKVGIAPVDGVCSTDILVVVPKAKHWYSYTLCLVSSKAFIDYTDSHSAGTRMPRTNWKDMCQFSLVRPPLALLEVFESVTSTHTKQIIENIFESRSLSNLRDTLLPKLISGELRVPDAEKFIAEAGV